MSARSDGKCYNCWKRLVSTHWECEACSRPYCGTYCMQEQYYDHKLLCNGAMRERVKKPESKKKGVPCRFFLNGHCKNGSKCEFLHQSEKMICEYFLAGTCKFGSDCVNWHTPTYSAKVKETKEVKKPKQNKVKEKEAPICTHFQKGKCEYGSSCFKKHIKPEPSAAAKTAPKAKQMLSDLVLNVEKQRPKNLKKETVTDREEEKENYKYVKVCEFYNRGTCAYGDRCTKAHEKLPLYKKDLKPEMMMVKKQVIESKKAEPVVNNNSPVKVKVEFSSPDLNGQFMNMEIEDEIFMSDSECSDYDESYREENSAASSGDTFRSNQQSPGSLGGSPNFGNANKLSQPEINGRENNNRHLPENLFEKECFEEEILDKYRDQTKIIKEKPKVKNKVRSKVKELYNPYEILQNFEDSMNESENEQDDQQDWIEGEEEDIMPVQTEETKITAKEAKKKKKELKKKEKETSLRIIVDNLRYEGNNQFDEGNFKKAISLYTTAIGKSGPNNPILLDCRAAAFLEDGQYRLAFNDTMKSLDLEKSNSKATLRFLKCAVILGKIVDGKEKLKLPDITKKSRQEFEEKFKRIETYHKEILKLINKENYEKAEGLIEKVRKVCFKSAEFLMLFAVNHALQGDLVRAESLLEELDTKDSNAKCSWYYFLIGIINYHKNELVRSITGFSEAKKEIPKAERWHEKVSLMHSNFQHAVKLIKSKTYNEAIAMLSGALKVGSDNRPFKLKVYKERSAAYLKIKEHNLALKDLTVALSIEDKDSKLWLMRGDTYRELGDLHKCLEDYREAEELTPSLKVHMKIKEVERELKQQELHKNSYYNILGVPTNVDQQTLKQEFYKKAKMFHPDKHTDAPEKEKKQMENKMKDITRAYAVLSDEQKRQDYDYKLACMEDSEDEDEYESDDDFGFSPEEFFYFVRMFHMTGGVGFW